MQSPKSNVVRAGAAAFAVGVGIALANGAAIASASTEGADSGTSDSSSERDGATKADSPDNADTTSQREESAEAPSDSAVGDSDESPEADEDASSDEVDSVDDADVEEDDADDVSDDSESAPDTSSDPQSEDTSADDDVRADESSGRPDTSTDDVAVEDDAREPDSAESAEAAAEPTVETDVVETVAPSTVAPTAQSVDTPTSDVDRHSSSLLAANVGGPVDNPLSQLFAALFEFVRRTFFNQGPILAPRQYGQMPNGQIVGTVGGADPDGDEVVYKVGTGPENGHVAIAANGSFTYTPTTDFAASGGEDTFTVVARDKGFHINLLNLFRPSVTTTSITVSVKPVDAELVGTTGRFTIWNYTSKDITYQSMTPLDGTKPSDLLGPAVGAVIEPGGTFHFELTDYWFGSSKGYATFTSGPETWWAGLFRYGPYILVGDEEPSMVTCNSSGGSCSPFSPSKEVAGSYVYLLDAPGTTVVVPDGSQAQQLAVVNGLCHDKGPAKCTFKTTRTTTEYTGAHNVGDIVMNDTNEQQQYSFTIQDAQSVSNSLQISAKESFKALFGSFDAEFQETYGHTWTDTTTYSRQFTLKIDPGMGIQVIAEQPLLRMHGDVTVTMGNSTWTLQNIYIDTPDPKGTSRYTYQNVPAEQLGELDGQGAPGTSVEIISVTPVEDVVV